MTRALLAVGLLVLASLAEAQGTPDLPMCAYTDAPGLSRQATLANGVTVELRRSADADAVEDACTLRVTEASGRVVLERAGFNARVVPATGNDLDGDGVPDAVLSIDDGGGNRCCWNTIVLTLSTPARVRAAVPEPLGWRFDPARKRYVAEEVLAFYQLGPDMASSPMAIRFHRLGPSGFEDVTSDYCRDLLDPQGRGPFSRDDDRRVLTDAARADSRASRGDTYRNEQVRIAAMSMALQYHVCGRSRDADALIDDVFPPSLAAATRQRVGDAVESYRPK